MQHTTMHRHSAAQGVTVPGLGRTPWLSAAAARRPLRRCMSALHSGVKGPQAVQSAAYILTGPAQCSDFFTYSFRLFPNETVPATLCARNEPDA